MSAYKFDIEPFEADFEFEDTLESFDEFPEEAQDSFAENSEQENWSLDPELTDRLQDESPVDEAESWAWEAAPEFELLPETAAVRSSRAGEQYVDTSTWNPDPLRAHGGTGANVLLRWNNVPSDTRSIDVVVHLHGFIGEPPNAQMLRAVAARGGLDLSGRTRPTLAILPRGRRITPEEVRQKQARLNELANQSGKKPGTARSDVYTFPALWRDGGAGLESLITRALQWFAQHRGGGAALPIARLIFTAHSGGGAWLNLLVALHARRKVCNPDEVHAFDALYSKPSGLESWVSARLSADRRRGSDQLDTLGGALRVFYLPGGLTQTWSRHLARSLPGRRDALSRRYRAECTRVGHLKIPNAFGPALLRDAAADLAALQPCSGGTPSKPATSKSSRPKQSRSSTPARSAELELNEAFEVSGEFQSDHETEHAGAANESAPQGPFGTLTSTAFGVGSEWETETTGEFGHDREQSEFALNEFKPGGFGWPGEMESETARPNKRKDPGTDCGRSGAPAALVSQPGGRCIGPTPPVCPSVTGILSLQSIGNIPFEYIASVGDNRSTNLKVVTKRLRPRTQRFLPSVRTALTQFADNMNRFGMPIEAILTAGSYCCRCISRTNRLSNHSAGHAFDLVGVRWASSGGRETIVHNWNSSERPWLRRINACLRLSFATVLDYYVKGHQDHFHCDTPGRARNPRAPTTLKFAQEALSVVLGRTVPSSGRFDAATQTALIEFAGGTRETLNNSTQLNEILDRLFTRIAAAPSGVA